MILQGHTCVFVHLILQFSSSQDTNTNTMYNVQIKIMYNLQTQVILQGHANMHFSSSDNTKLEAFCIVTIYSFCQENMLANRYVWF